MTDHHDAPTLFASAQSMVLPGDVAGNIDRMEPLVEIAADSGAVAVLFSECHLTGYDKKDVGISAALAIDDPALDRVAGLAASHDIVVIAGLYEQHDDGVYNTAVVFYPDGHRVVQRKHSISPHEVGRIEAAPREFPIFEIAGRKCGMLICSDSGTKGIDQELAVRGCQLVLAPTAGIGDAGRGFSEADFEDADKLAKYIEMQHAVYYPASPFKRARSYNLATVAANQVGYDKKTGYFHPGHCLIVNRRGMVTDVAPGEFCFEFLEERLAIGEVD